MQFEYQISTTDQLEKLAEILLDKVKNIRVFLFRGDLGAGKTTMIQKLVSKLGSEDSVSSPSFSIVNEYKMGQESIYHMDLYRLKSVEELEELGFFEYIESGSYCFIEWPDLAWDYLESPLVQIKMEILENNDRIILFLVD